jgi:recombinational DNA repair protein (RecF pathway)
MQGFILNYNRSREEDLIVTILTHHEVKTLYRFYGARHSVINIGYKLDFEEEVGVKVTINRLKDTIHLGFDWLYDRDKLYHWQEFIKLLYRHLKDITEIEPFYIELLNELSKKLSTQSPKRAILEGYIKLLEYEGRLYKEFYCLICEEEIEDRNIVLVRSFNHAHHHCIPKYQFDRKKIATFFDTTNAFGLSDLEVERLWAIMSEGL